MCANERRAARKQMIASEPHSDTNRHEHLRRVIHRAASARRLQRQTSSIVVERFRDSRDRLSEQEHERVAQVHKLHGQVVHFAIVLCTRFHSPKRALVTSVGRCTAAWGDRGFLHKSRQFRGIWGRVRDGSECASRHVHVGAKAVALGTVAAICLAELTEGILRK